MKNIYYLLLLLHFSCILTMELSREEKEELHNNAKEINYNNLFLDYMEKKNKLLKEEI